MPGEFVAFARDLGELVFQFDDAADGRQGHALAFHDQHLLNVVDVVAAVAALAGGGTLRGDNLVVIDAAQERLLDVQHVSDLADGEQRRVFVVQGKLHVAVSFLPYPEAEPAVDARGPAQ